MPLRGTTSLVLRVVLLDCQWFSKQCTYDSRARFAAYSTNQQSAACKHASCATSRPTHFHWRHTLAELQLQKHDLTMHSLAQNTQPLDNSVTIAS